MSTNFNNVPIRQNSKNIDASWWNALRQAGIVFEAAYTALTASFGSITAPATFAIGNTVTDGAITGLVLSSAVKKSKIEYWAKRKATATLMEVGTIFVWHDGTQFYINRPIFAGDADISFDIDATTGQVYYNTGTMAGSYDAANSNFGWIVTTQG